MAGSSTGRATRAERRARGEALRASVDLDAWASWYPDNEGRDPIGLLTAQDGERIADLVPIRYGRMLVSPPAFYRGGAAIMAADLAGLPVSGLTAQLCGDAHLGNFGYFATPERRVVFDMNDFDETLPGPWEWDLARLTASVVITAQWRGFSKKETRRAARSCVGSYAWMMGRLAAATTLDAWYWQLDVASWLRDAEEVASLGAKRRRDAMREVGQRGSGRKDLMTFIRGTRRDLGKAHRRTQAATAAALTEPGPNGHLRIRPDPPYVVPILAHDENRLLFRRFFRAYHASLPPARRVLLERYQFQDLAHKVVGVGSVGLRTYVALFVGGDADDRLFLQFKQAGTSALEAHLPRSAYRHHGRRVVEGQRLMQAASDIFLGWASEPPGTDFYCRQLRDKKLAVRVESLDPPALAGYGSVCAALLARGHARSGDACAISGYLGDDDRFCRALTAFGEAYADQTERDYDLMMRALADGRIRAQDDGAR